MIMLFAEAVEAVSYNWSQLISSLGFPIVCCGICMYYVKYSNDKNREDVSKLNEDHREEVQSLNASHKEDINRMTEAIENNTKVVTELCAKLDSLRG